VRRRSILVTCGAALTAGLAGCSGGGDGGGSDGDETETDPAMDSATPTDTPTDTPTETATETPEPSTVTESVGQSFTVGEGDRAVGFTFERLLRAQALGPTQNEEATDTYVIAILTVENPQSRTIDVPVGNMRLRATGTVKNVDLAASQALGEDRRIDVDSIASASIPAGESVTGGIVYDAPAGSDYRIEITPLDGAEGRPHELPIGDISELDALESGY
jgi:hypothetical protein